MQGPSQTPSVRFLLKPHYLINLLLSMAFFIFKTTPPMCTYYFGSCDFEMRELELMAFLGCILAVKNRKQRSSLKEYISTMCMFTKIMTTFLISRYSMLAAGIYLTACILHLVFLPQPADYSGPDNLTYFRGPHLQDELQAHKDVVWLVEFYAPWSPPCVDLAPIFGKISHSYSLNNLRFGKIDASRYSEVAKQYRVDGSSWSKQLPSVVLFVGGKEKQRRPYVDQKGIVHKFSFTEKEIIEHFDLKNLYKTQKAKDTKRDRSSSAGDKKTN